MKDAAIATPNVGTSDSPLLPANRQRVGLIISAPATNRITISLKGPAVLDKGITLYPSLHPLILSPNDFG